MLFFLQAEDGIRDGRVTGVQTCALPISPSEPATTAADVAGSLGVAVADVDFALGALEHEGFVLRGRFTPGVAELQWCERRLLARIHRYTLDRLRQEIEPVTAADFMRFLLRWQRVAPDARAEGPEGLGAVLE